MRPILLCCVAVSLTACAKGGEQARSGAAAAVNLADYAGTWNAQSLAEGSDSVELSYVVNATATTEGWTFVLPGRDPLPLQVTVSGDSVMTKAGPFESALRAGVQVTTEGVGRVVNGEWTGRLVAHYQTAGADSVVTRRFRATRAP